MKTQLKTLAFVVAMILAAPAVHAACEVVKGGAKSAFDGKSLAGLEVEKKSLMNLNKEHPSLNAVEQAFKGAVKTCTDCSDNYVTCN